MTTGITDAELLRLFEYKDALQRALSEIGLTGVSSISLNGRSMTRQSASEIRKELGITDRQILNRLAFLGGNDHPELRTITFY